MSAVNKVSLIGRNGITYLPTESVFPSPVQPRKHFSQESLTELAQSISLYGILNPLTVRRHSGKYELVAGERRLRAAKLAGLSEVPCIVIDVNTEEASLLALVENIQRRDLDFVEEADGIFQMISLFGMSQEEAARRLGKSQPAIANKLRILKLPADILDRLREEGLTERHGRALLRLPSPEERRRALDIIIREKMNVSASEEYIETLLSISSELQKRPKRKFILKDVRVFLNTLIHGLDIMKQGGIDAEMKKHETDSELVLTISIPKQK